ncbi:MAG: hypothetical protein SFY81_15205 [Verrucomicrobiota bacterium]|nr:hypothetical protein [Verrucomicrobiota bacterium]
MNPSEKFEQVLDKEEEHTESDWKPELNNRLDKIIFSVPESSFSTKSFVDIEGSGKCSQSCSNERMIFGYLPAIRPDIEL